PLFRTTELPMTASPTLIAHGRMTCDRCWAGCGDTMQALDGAQLVRDPGHWGSDNPQVLVLGISKGNTQAAAYENEPFDTVAFKGIRDRMLQVFQSVGLLPNETLSRFELRFTSAERDFAFASLIRCSLSAWNETKGKFVADSPDILKALRQGRSGRPIAEACIDQHLAHLPSR